MLVSLLSENEARTLPASVPCLRGSSHLEYPLLCSHLSTLPKPQGPSCSWNHLWPLQSRCEQSLTLEFTGLIKNDDGDNGDIKVGVATTYVQAQLQEIYRYSLTLSVILALSFPISFIVYKWLPPYCLTFNINVYSAEGRNWKSPVMGLHTASQHGVNSCELQPLPAIR